MDVGASPSLTKLDEELAKKLKRIQLKELNAKDVGKEPAKALDSSLKKHTALIKRIRLSIGIENRDQVLKDIEGLSLEKYVEEICGAAVEGMLKCKNEKDVWSAVEIISALHRRFPNTFTPGLVAALSTALAPASKTYLSSLTPDQREKEDSARITRQRPVLRVCAELALVGIIKDGPKKSGGEWIMKVVRDLLSNDPTLSSLPLLSIFLKSYSLPYLGIAPPSSTSKQVPVSSEPGTLSDEAAAAATSDGGFPTPANSNTKEGGEGGELIEKDIRDRFKKMCEGYFESVSKKLVIEHNRLQEQDRKNHEAYIRSGEIFEDRQQAYEKMTKGYEKLLSSCQTLSELLYLPMPALKTTNLKSDSIQIGTNNPFLDNGDLVGEGDGFGGVGGSARSKWEDEEERRFFEDIPDLRDYVPRGVLGVKDQPSVNGNENKKEGSGTNEEREREEHERREREIVEEEVRKLDEELARLENSVNTSEEGKEGESLRDGEATGDGVDETLEEEDDTSTPTPRASPPGTPSLTSTSLPLASSTTDPEAAVVPAGPSQLLTALLTRLPDATNRSLIDQAAVDFAFLNSKAARKRLVKFMGQTPRNRIDLLPHYSRLIATLAKYMPDVGSEVVAHLEQEFKYLQRKKHVVKELSEDRLKTMTFLSNLTKFRVVPSHVILHMFKVCLDDFGPTNVENVALLLEGCGRFLLRSEDTKVPFGKMVELMRRKQSMRHLDQRQLLLLENAYYQCNPPERAAREEKQRTPIELFIHHLIYDVLTKKTIDKVLKLLRKLDWTDPLVNSTLHKVFTKPWKLKYSNIALLAMLTYDLQRYHSAFVVGVVDQVLEDSRRGLEVNTYALNQRRVALVKFLGELYIYRLVGSGIIFDTLWTFVTFGHPEGRPLPGQPCAIDMPDDFFRIRLICVLLDACGMCFDRGPQQKKLDNFLVFFQMYVFCKAPLPIDVDFMLNDSLEAVRPKLAMFKSFEEAANAVDEMFNTAFQNAGLTTGEDSGGESGEEDERREASDDEDGERLSAQSPVDDRAPSPEAVLLKHIQETLGPSEEDDADFAKELAKLVTESSSESRKVDKKTALALWETSIPPPGMRKKKMEEVDDDEPGGEDSRGQEAGVMNFTVFTKRGNKPQTRQLAIPAESALAIQTRTAQLQDKVEQQHLKRLVLSYEQREEAEELKALEARSRTGAIKIRYVG